MEDGPVQTLSFVGAPAKVVVREDFKNDTANGTRLWEAGMLMARYAEANWVKQPDMVRGKRILELGAGTGILSIYLAHLGAARVVACDYNKLVRRLLKRNVAENRVSERVEVRNFDWSNAAHMEAACGEQWDLVVGADCVFSLAATEQLVECQRRLIPPGSPVLCYQSIETRDDAVTAAYVRGMEEAGFEVTTVSLRGVAKKYQHEDMAIYRSRRRQ